MIDMGIWLCNKVPVNIKQLNKYKPFKRKSQCFLTNHAFYSIDKFLSQWLDEMRVEVIIRHITILQYPLVSCTVYNSSVFYCCICADVKYWYY